MSYGMIDTKIFDSTVMVLGSDAVYVFMSMIALADKTHVCDFGRNALAMRIGVTLDHLDKALHQLSQPDPESKSQAFEGRRIVPLNELNEVESNRGWFMVNREDYISQVQREKRNSYQKELMRKIRDSSPSKGQGQNVSSLLDHVDVDVNQDIKNNKVKTKAFDLFWEAFPRKVKKKRAKEIWLRKNYETKLWQHFKPVAEVIMLDITNRLENHAPWKNGYIPHPTTYLNGELWNDEIEKEDLVQVKKGNGKHLVPSYKDEEALESYGKSIDKLPKRTESYYQYWQRLCVHAEQEGKA